MRYLVVFAAAMALISAFPQGPESASSENPPNVSSTTGPTPLSSGPATAGSSPLPKTSDQNATVVDKSYDIDANGNFNYSYETSNGIKVEQRGMQKPKDNAGNTTSSPGNGENTTESDTVQVLSGSYSFQAPDGKVYNVRYCADERGYRAVQTIGKHLPAPLPEECSSWPTPRKVPGASTSATPQPTAPTAITIATTTTTTTTTTPPSPGASTEVEVASDLTT